MCNVSKAESGSLKIPLDEIFFIINIMKARIFYIFEIEGVLGVLGPQSWIEEGVTADECDTMISDAWNRMQ